VAEALLTHRGFVYPWQCDHMGHMNVMWYVGKFDEASWAFLATLGLTPSELRAANRGVVAVEQTISYKRELLAGDVLSIYSEPLEIKDKSLRFRHEMRNEETREVAAITDLLTVHIDTKLRKACSIPQSVRDSVLARLGAG
jgi:acyl-CoA thioester hydrolase